MREHKDVLILTQEGANLDFVNKVNVYIHKLYDKGRVTEDKM